MKLAVEAGRLAYRAGRIPRRSHASASSPVDGRIAAGGRGRRGPRRRLMADHAVEPLEAVLRRLKEERDEADARYNDALTARRSGAPCASADSLSRRRRSTTIRSRRSTTPGTSCPPHRDGARSPAEGGRVHLARHRPVPAAAADVQLAAGRSHQSQCGRGPRGAAGGRSDRSTRCGISSRRSRSFKRG